MICYKDMTFCSRDCANMACKRNKQNIDKAPHLEWLPIAYSNFKSCEKFKNMERGGVMVVRCEDCKYWTEEKDEEDDIRYGWCRAPFENDNLLVYGDDATRIFTAYDFFCKSGKRR